MQLRKRFSVEMNWDLDNQIQYFVKDCGEVVFETEIIESKLGEKGHWDLDDSEALKAHKWLEKKHPDWKNCSAYWD